MISPITSASKFSNWQQVAEIFAALANTEQLSTLEHWQKEKLVSDVKKIGMINERILKLADLPRDLPYAARSITVGKAAVKEMASRLKRAAKNKVFSKSWNGRKIPYEWLGLWEIHPFAYRLINQLVDYGEADVRNFREKVFRPVAICTSQKRGIAVRYDLTEMALDGLFESLWQTLTLYPFPFIRCSLCKTIFIPASKKQKKYCSKECGNKAIGLTPKRRDYMKSYMADKRKTEREARTHGDQ